MSKFGAYLKTKDFRKTILLASGAVIVVVLIAFFSLGRIRNSPRALRLRTYKRDPARELLGRTGCEGD